MQQLFLRWNQGQDLRQALITIAISIILADQMLAHFGGVAEDIAWPRNFDTFTNLRVSGIQYTTTRLVILGIARRRSGCSCGSGSSARARHGDPRRRRRPRDGLGARDQHPAHVRIAFFVGSALAGLGGVFGGSFASLAPGVDANWLLYSLVVVIIGGMGSLGGAAIGALLLGLTSNFAAAYLPSSYTYYSMIFTFVLVASCSPCARSGSSGGRRERRRAVTTERRGVARSCFALRAARLLDATGSAQPSRSCSSSASARRA